MAEQQQQRKPTIKVQLKNATKLDFRAIKSLTSEGPWPTRNSKEQPPAKDNLSTPKTTLEWNMEGVGQGRATIGKTEMVSEAGYLSIIWRFWPNGVFDYDVRTSNSLKTFAESKTPSKNEAILAITITGG